MDELLEILKKRFAAHPRRHPGIEWSAVEAKLAVKPEALRSLAEMERTGGEPDVTGYDAATGEFIFTDCAAESPKGRRSLCYDRAGLESRKDFPPENTAVDVAAEMGIKLLDEEEYFALQRLENFDLKTSSWILTPPEFRKLGGALFAECRFERVFTYHNGAQSYYAARGFRGSLRV